MNAALPHSNEPTGALNPLLTQKATLSPSRATSAVLTPSATAALKSLAPSMWTEMSLFVRHCAQPRQAGKRQHRAAGVVMCRFHTNKRSGDAISASSRDG